MLLLISNSQILPWMFSGVFSWSLIALSYSIREVKIKFLWLRIFFYILTPSRNNCRSRNFSKRPPVFFSLYPHSTPVGDRRVPSPPRSRRLATTLPSPRRRAPLQLVTFPSLQRSPPLIAWLPSPPRRYPRLAAELKSSVFSVPATDQGWIFVQKGDESPVPASKRPDPVATRPEREGIEL